MAKSKRPSKRQLKKPRIPIELVTKKVPGSLQIKKYLNVKWTQSNQITNQIIQAVKAAATAAGKTTEAAAMADWRSVLQPAIYAKLMKGGDWVKDGAAVLSVAGDMGTIASLLSGTNPEAGGNQLRAAFAATKTHTTCSSGGGVGGGDWCTFSWV